MTIWQTIIETKTFSKTSKSIADEDTIEDMLEYIAKTPLAGDIIEGTGGCRKIRWQRNKSMGKSGGMRTIYYFYNHSMPIYMLLAYAKNQRDNISQETKNILKSMVNDLIKSHKGEENEQY
ncbi:MULTISPECIES: type II toxin-antitoxin system RelE/ParE family toxin [Cysteiniphilum]|uniref:type II toxin-antitoxin system RelE/ParE family toxin n=1 Tax=Cysteiniphilum TaxID=2056696 RepID=UPI00177D6EA7|nr:MULTISPECIES: type II toxin-antitoxin system RelE/ParE family toxin [Cysteiniphilum]